MKARFTTTMYDGTDADGNPVRLPDLNGEESDAKYSVSGDNAPGNEVLVAVTGTASRINTISNGTETTMLTDAEAGQWMKDHGLGGGIASSDIADEEIQTFIRDLQTSVGTILTDAEHDKLAILLDLRRGLQRYFSDDPDPAASMRSELTDIYGNQNVRSKEELVNNVSDADARNIVETYNLKIPPHINPETAARAVQQVKNEDGTLVQAQDELAFCKLAGQFGVDVAEIATSEIVKGRTKGSNDAVDLIRSKI